MSPVRTITIVIPTYNHAAYLWDALLSCFNQSVLPDEIIVVDDGSSDDPAAVVREFPGVILLRQDNLGLAAARNAGLARASGDGIVFLDADDRLLPPAIAAGLACHHDNGDAGFVYGAFRFVDEGLRPATGDIFAAPGRDPHLTFMTRGNVVGMHGAVMYQRRALESEGGFDETLRECEDLDVYLRMSRTRLVAAHGKTVAEYRRHGGNMSKNRARMLATASRVLMREAERSGGSANARAQAEAGIAALTRIYAGPMVRDAIAGGVTGAGLRRAVAIAARHPADVVATVADRIRDRTARRLPRPLGELLYKEVRVPQRRRVDPRALERQVAHRQQLELGAELTIPQLYLRGVLPKWRQQAGDRALEIWTAPAAGLNRRPVCIPALLMPGSETIAAGQTPASLETIILLAAGLPVEQARVPIRQAEELLEPGGRLLLSFQLVRSEPRDHASSMSTIDAVRSVLASVFPDVRIWSEGNDYAALAAWHGLLESEIDQAALQPADPARPVVIFAECRKRTAASPVSRDPEPSTPGQPR
jgi:hypothetical protein